MTTPASWLKTRFDYEFDDATLLSEALTHRSASGANNERLEFLGDAVLDFVVSDMLIREYPQANEGDLSRLRATLVRDATLAEIATALDLGTHIVLGSGELRSGGFRRASILADALEALFGAIYLDGGFEAAAHSIRRLFADRARELPSVDVLKDAKTLLQERLQADGHALPEYVTESVSGKAHRQTFEVSCSVAALKQTTRGSGGSRRAAEQEAARRMLAELDDAGLATR